MEETFGRRCEGLASGYLTGKGLAFVARNLRMRQGEVDLLFRDGETLVFVEVKARRQGRFGLGYEAVDARKQRRIMAVARAYLATRPECPCRFDVVSVAVENGRPRIEHLVAAFP